MRLAARIEPTKHVLNLVAFAQSILEQAQERGLLPRRHYRRRRHVKEGNPVPTKGNPKKVKGKQVIQKEKHPLLTDEKEE